MRGGSFLVSFVTRHASTRREGRPTEGRETVHGHNVACGRWEQEGKKKEKKIISPSSTQFDGKGKHRFVLSSRPLSLSLSLRGQLAAVAPSWSRGRHRRPHDKDTRDGFDALRLGSRFGAGSWRRVIGVAASHAQGRRNRPPRRPRCCCFLLLLATAAATAARLLPHLLGLGDGGPDRPVPVPR